MCQWLLTFRVLDTKDCGCCGRLPSSVYLEQLAVHSKIESELSFSYHHFRQHGVSMQYHCNEKKRWRRFLLHLQVSQQGKVTFTLRGPWTWDAVQGSPCALMNPDLSHIQAMHKDWAFCQVAYCLHNPCFIIRECKRQQDSTCWEQGKKLTWGFILELIIPGTL